jgi:drug/metabolite transporter (DMT)-like permease
MGNLRSNYPAGDGTMTTLAIALLTISAFTHAFWNFLSKQRNPSALFFLVASLVASLVLSPVLFIYRVGLIAIPSSVWGLILFTGAAQASYYIFLAGAYRRGDLSHAYPMARSLPVVLVAMVSLALGRGAQIQPMAYAGLVLVAGGCILLPLPSFRNINMRQYLQSWVLYAVLAAACITAYTLLDDQSLHILRPLEGTVLTDLDWSLLYLELETLSLTIFLGGILLVFRQARGEMQHTMTALINAGWVGLVITVTYGLVLLAMGNVKNVSYVSAFRQLGIPISAGLGLLLRKEAAYPPKLVGIGIVMAGLILVAIG